MAQFWRGGQSYPGRSSSRQIRRGGKRSSRLEPGTGGAAGLFFVFSPVAMAPVSRQVPSTRVDRAGDVSAKGVFVKKTQKGRNGRRLRASFDPIRPLVSVPVSPSFRLIFWPCPLPSIEPCARANHRRQPPRPCCALFDATWCVVHVHRCVPNILLLQGQLVSPVHAGNFLFLILSSLLSAGQDRGGRGPRLPEHPPEASTAQRVVVSTFDESLPTEQLSGCPAETTRADHQASHSARHFAAAISVHGQPGQALLPPSLAQGYPNCDAATVRARRALPKLRTDRPGHPPRPPQLALLCPLVRICLCLFALSTSRSSTSTPPAHTPPSPALRPPAQVERPAPGPVKARRLLPLQIGQKSLVPRSWVGGVGRLSQHSCSSFSAPLLG